MKIIYQNLRQYFKRKHWNNAKATKQPKNAKREIYKCSYQNRRSQSNNLNFYLKAAKKKEEEWEETKTNQNRAEGKK